MLSVNATDKCFQLMPLTNALELMSLTCAFVRRAGYLLGVLLLQRDLKAQVLPPIEVGHLIRKTIESGKKVRAVIDGKLLLKTPLMYRYHGKPYLGTLVHNLSSFDVYYAHYMRITSYKIDVDLRGLQQISFETRNFLGRFPSEKRAFFKNVEVLRSVALLSMNDRTFKMADLSKRTRIVNRRANK